MQQRSHRKPQKRAQYGQDDVLAENVAVRLAVVEAEHFDGCDLAFAFGDVDVREVIQHDERQRRRAQYDDQHDIPQTLHHRRHAAAEIAAEGDSCRVFRARERCGRRLRILVRLIVDPCGLVSGRFAEDVLPGSLRQIDVIINIVFKHSLDGQFRPAHVACL